ncbi:MAG: hypothetical protein GY874_19225 [Desulfobacteraceae bacterium]|nr:hypothetical protein [Desulfobacteraceae bacterium]
MIRKLIFSFLLLMLSTSTASAGLYYSGHSTEPGTVTAAVEIKDKGLYNLVVTLQFLRTPNKDKKIYRSDEYEKLVDRLLVESRGIALQKILERKELTIGDLAGLKKAIETDIETLAAQLKMKILPHKDVEVIFSISDFFLLQPSYRK